MATSGDDGERSSTGSTGIHDSGATETDSFFALFANDTSSEDVNGVVANPFGSSEEAQAQVV
ncbi:hypothetical protein OsJ_31125 [Oryza sativa Japonica Group]|uniref:Uncharacterized protein n=4 Tax=Oryza TaxID=4527 RepID=A0A979HJH3_ORYSJ|nr:Hypothetical protein [Oryza sativa Japonica Group]AAP53104.1 hypothetical protein LOC_Os10g19250 [Oryza sativa Japonica Group]EAZ15710.1 hypothetical protein OsJ_31125 [Oryza sativa Japonica Group]